MLRIESNTKRQDGNHDRRYKIKSREFIVSEAGKDIALVAAGSGRGAIQRTAMHLDVTTREGLDRWEVREA